MLLARGGVHDRPFGKTIGMLARRGLTGQLAVESDGRHHTLVLEGGHVVAAESPAAADRAVAVALEDDLITREHAEVVDRWLAAVPDADEVEVCAIVGLLSGDDAHRLRRRTIARRAARVIALEHGEFRMTTAITVAVVPDCEMHVGGVIYHAANRFVFELDAIVEKLGRRFELRRDCFDSLPNYGFGDRERTILKALARGVSIEEVQSIAETTERRRAQAVVYALASCGALYCEATAPTRLARGTRNPIEAPAADATPAFDARVAMMTEPITASTAADAFERGQRALRAERLADAVAELELATRLAPKDMRYLATLAWARFCAADDKASVSGETRRLLKLTIARADAPAVPHYYLGLVERILDRTDRALEHFLEVLELEPDHPHAATEVRFLMRARQ